MLLEKTAKARSCLLERPAELSLFERRILILSDGKREREEIVGMLGQPSQALVDKLLLDDYLVVVREAVAPAAGARSTVTGLIRAVAAATTAATAQTSRAPSALQASPVDAPDTATTQVASTGKAPVARRSMAATRMYMIDMLQLQRTPEAATLKQAVQLCNHPDELIGNVLVALAHLREVTSPSYGQRVTERLTEVIPEQYLATLAAAIANHEPA